MIYLRQNKSDFFGGNKFRNFVILLVLTLIVFFSFSFLKNFFGWIGSGFYSVTGNLKESVLSTFSVLRSKNSLILENYDLKKQRTELEGIIVSLKSLKLENEELKKHLGRNSATKKMALAYVLAGPDQSPYDTILLDLGKNAGINEGDLVYAIGGAPIGTISKISPRTSVVELYSMPGRKSEVRIGESELTAIAYGRGGGNFYAELPRESDVKEGDNISFPAIKASLFAVVENVEISPADSFLKIFFKLPVNIFDIKSVDVELREKI